MWHSPRRAAERLSLDLQPVTESPALLSLYRVAADAVGVSASRPSTPHLRLFELPALRNSVIAPEARERSASRNLPLVFPLGGVGGLGRTGAEGEQVVGRLRRGARGADDGAIVLAQDLEPGSDIVGMAHRRDDAERGADEGAGHLGNQFLLRIQRRAETARQISPETGGMAAPMAELVQGCPVPVDRLEIGVGPRDLDEIVARAVEGALAANAEVGAGGGDQRFGARLDEPFWNRRGRCRQRRGQVLALVGVEHREALEERDRVGLVAIAFGPPAFLVRREAVGIDHGRAGLALADMTAETERLAEGEPALAGEAALDDGAPQDEHVDA